MQGNPGNLAHEGEGGRGLGRWQVCILGAKQEAAEEESSGAMVGAGDAAYRHP